MFVDQVTLVTPTLSLAFPENASESDVVETVVLPGDEMLNAGAVVSFGEGGGGGGGGVSVRVTVSVFETLVESSVAVTVIEFTPIANGILAMLQLPPAMEAVPDAF